MVEMVIYGVSFDMIGKQPIVLLKTVLENKFLPIWIGHAEAAAILMTLQGATPARPTTHDLLVSAIAASDAEIEGVAITELRDSTFFAAVKMRTASGDIVELDSRPSDAIAIAVRTKATILASEDIVAENSIEFESGESVSEETLSEFRDFLEGVSPEDFRIEDN